MLKMYVQSELEHDCPVHMLIYFVVKLTSVTNLHQFFSHSNDSNIVERTQRGN